MTRATGLVMLSLGMSMAAYGGTIVNLTLDGNFAAPDYAFYNYTDTAGVSHTQIPVGPYITSLTGGSYNNTTAYTICYDFDSPTNVGTSYPGQFMVLTDAATMEATYLVNKLNLLGGINGSLAPRGAISMAIWEIMYPSSPTKSGAFPSDPAAQSYEAEAIAAVMSNAWTAADSALYPTWVPSDPTIQRFGTIFTTVTGVSSPTPEPASLVLIGLGIIGIAGIKYRRRATKESSRV